MIIKQTINSFSARTADRLTSARRATLTMLATFLIAMTAQTAWADGVNYINASGNPDSHAATELASSNAAVELVGGWYVVNGNVTINGELTFTSDVDLILADGATLSVKGLYCKNGTSNQNLTIYGQSLGTGKVSSDAYHTDNINYADIRAANITINGGIVVAESVDGGGSNNMPGIIASGNLTIKGGQVSSANAKVKVGGTITLGWMKATDFIWVQTIYGRFY